MHAVECTCCNHRCIILPGKQGTCKVRYNENGKLYLSVYNKPCALNVDPVEKKPLHHFLPGTKIFSIGTIGCNFCCSFCQNWDISQTPLEIEEIVQKKGGDLEDMIGKIQEYGYDATPEQIVKTAIDKGCKSIAFTYNEPSIWAEYSHDIGVLAMKEGMPCVYVSNGFMTEEHLNYIKPYVKAINIDFKSFSNKFYRKECGASVDPIKENIKLAFDLGIWVEVTTLIIPDLNDSDDELRKIAGYIASVSTAIPWHVSAFHPSYKMMDKGRTPVSTLDNAYKIGKAAGLKYVYKGNVKSEGENTYCPKCSSLLINRNGYQTQVQEGFKGKCNCGEIIEGYWNS